MENHPDFNFAKLVDGLCKAKKIIKKDLAPMIGYNKRVFSKMNHGHIPRRTGVIAMGVAFGFNINQMYSFLFLAGYSFSLGNKIDDSYITVIKKYGGDGSKRIDACNEELAKMGVERAYLIGSSSIR